MILKGFVAAIVLSFAWIKSVAGATSYSNVYMQSEPGYAFYRPAAIRTAQVAPVAAAPLMSSLLPPCVSPCVVPGQQVAALAPVATSSANYASYKSPISMPVVVAPSNNDATSYGYSYFVYDEGTGDQKTQKETSDGSVVRGQYSLIQPDGFIREVQYTADDLRGFNTIVKNFLPKAETKALPPCPEVKSEPLKESNEIPEEAHDLEPKAAGEAQGEESENNGEHAEPERRGSKGPEPEGYGSPDEPKSQEENGEPGNGKPEGQEGHSAQEEDPPEEHAEPESNVESLSEEHGSEEKKEKEPRAAQGTEGLPVEENALVSYNDIIKCLQAAIKGANLPQPPASPLTYIIFNKPC